MKLSTKGQYGVLAMYELANHYGEGPMSIKEIATKQHVSDAYLEQLFSKLKKAGLIKSLRGSHGGYHLTREPAAISVGQVIDAVEGPIEFCGCDAEDVSCNRALNCPTAGLWADVQKSIRSVIDHRTLADLVMAEKEMEKQSAVRAAVKEKRKEAESAAL